MSNSAMWLRIQVTDMNTGERKANVRLPAGLASFGMKMALKYAPASIEGLDLEELFSAVKDGGESLLVDVEDEDKREHVEVFVE